MKIKNICFHSIDENTCMHFNEIELFFFIWSYKFM